MNCTEFTAKTRSSFWLGTSVCNRCARTAAEVAPIEDGSLAGEEGRFIDEAELVAPGVDGVEGAFAPGAEGDLAGGGAVDFCGGKAVEVLGAFEDRFEVVG